MQKLGEVLQVTGRAPGLLNKHSSLLNAVLGIPPIGRCSRSSQCSMSADSGERVIPSGKGLVQLEAR